MSFPSTLQGDYGAWFQTGAVRLYPLGQRMLCPEGRIFRYAKVGSAGALTACQLAQAELEDAEHDAMAVQTQAVSGDTSLAFTNGTSVMAENEFQFGYLSVDTAAALGVAHRVAYHAAVPAGATGTVYFFEGDTIQVTISTARKVTLRKSMFKDIIVKPASEQTAMVVGVPQNAISASSYGWVQTHGMAGVLTEDAAAIAQMVRPSESALGSVSNMDMSEANDAATGIVGWMCDANSAAAKNANVFLTLEGAS